MKSVIISGLLMAAFWGMFGYYTGKRAADKWYADKARFELVDCSSFKKLPVHLVIACNGLLINDDTDRFIWSKVPEDVSVRVPDIATFSCSNYGPSGDFLGGEKQYCGDQFGGYYMDVPR